MTADGLHADAVATLSRWVAPDPGQDEVRRGYLRHLREHPDGLLRSCLPDHVTASTVVLSTDRRQVLLTLHAKAHAWFQMGGHCEAADTALAGAALREAAEESGIAGLVLDPEPLQLSTHDVPFCGPGGNTRHLDVRFLATAPADAAPAASVESLDVAWWPVDALPTREPDLVELISLARARAGSQSTRSSAAI